MVNDSLAGTIAADLRTLTHELTAAGEDSPRGLLGGMDGYGVDYANDVFEMFPFYWGDCTCGFEEAQTAWVAAHPHAPECYQEELARRGVGFDPDTWQKLRPELSWEQEGAIARELAAERGLDTQVGLLVHCDCYFDAAFEAWSKTHDHDVRCPTARPNFRHHASGFEVRWYKYIGRGMEFKGDMSARRWAQINAECLASVPEVLPVEPTKQARD